MPEAAWPKVPYIGVGCITMRDGKVLMVRSHNGYWSSPGGHLDFGESPADCAARETLEEVGLTVSNVEFVAITNDVFVDAGKHYVTIWMRGDPGDGEAMITAPEELSEIGWYAPDALPTPLHLFFDNLISGRCWPPAPSNLPEFSAASTPSLPPTPDMRP